MRASGAFSEAQQTTVNTQVNVGVQLPVPQGLKNKKLSHLTPVAAVES